MTESEGQIIVGALGQWASGMSTAARTLLSYFGGEAKAIFINDRELVQRQTVNHILELGDSEVKLSVEDDGQRRLDGEHVTIWQNPVEDSKPVDWSTYHRFDIPDNLLPTWLNRARVQVGRQICERSADGKPIAIEAGFGKNSSDHTVSGLFMRLEEAGVEAKQVKWIVVEAGFDKRAARNEKRRDIVPVEAFTGFASDGGDLDLDHENRPKEQGIIIKRVPNNHDDIERFRVRPNRCT